MTLAVDATCRSRFSVDAPEVEDNVMSNNRPTQPRGRWLLVAAVLAVLAVVVVVALVSGGGGGSGGSGGGY